MPARGSGEHTHHISPRHVPKSLSQATGFRLPPPSSARSSWMNPCHLPSSDLPAPTLLFSLFSTTQAPLPYDLSLCSDSWSGCGGPCSRADGALGTLRTVLRWPPGVRGPGVVHQSPTSSRPRVWPPACALLPFSELCLARLPDQARRTWPAGILPHPAAWTR